MPRKRPNPIHIATCLVEFGTQKACAEAKGWNEDQLVHWLREPEVKQAIDELSNRMFDESIRRLKCFNNTALDKLYDTLTSPTINPQIRMTAIRTALEYSFKSVEHFELRKELNEIRAELNALGESE